MSKTVAQQQLGRKSGFANVRWARAELLYPHPVAVIFWISGKMWTHGKLF
ncbi:MAG: hypothetical protein IKU39_01110 [Lachnospiraceae bacterium]|nr:hypothetical protein [Lachnospiraceae bacterium]